MLIKRLLIYLILLPSVNLMSCGQTSPSRRSSHRSSEDGSPSQRKATLTVMGSLADIPPDGATNQRNQKLTTHYEIVLTPGSILTPDDEVKNAAAKSAPAPQVTLALQNSAGKTTWEKTQEGFDSSWEIPLVDDGSNFKLLASVKTPPPAEVEAAKDWVKVFEVDRTLPNAALTTVLEAPDANGQRQIAVGITVTGESDVNCTDGQVEIYGNPTASPFTMNKSDSLDAAKNKVFKFDGHYAVSGKDLKIAPIIKASCTDKAGNKIELHQPAAAETVNLFLAAEVAGILGDFQGGGSVAKVTYLNSGDLLIKIKVLDPANSMPISPLLLDAIKVNLQLHVTDKAPTTVKDLTENKGQLWSQGYDSTLKVKLPPTRTGLQDLYLSMINRDGVAGTETLVNVVHLPIFIDATGPTVTFTSGVNFLVPTPGAVISLKAKVAIGGSPLIGDPKVELSTDGTTWTAADGVTVSVQDSDYTFAFAYPYSVEMPLRARIRARDLAGNEGVSSPSGLLVGRVKAADLVVNDVERNQCLAQSNPGARFKPWLASGYLCQKPDGMGGMASTPYASILMQNRGKVAPIFYQTTLINPGLGYQVYVDGTKVSTGRIEPPTGFALVGDARYLFNFPLSSDWLKGTKVEIYFDAEATDANSTTNGCYTTVDPFAKVVIIDQASKLVPAIGPYNCDPDQSL